MGHRDGFGQRIATTAASLSALAVTPGAAEAVVVHVAGSPVSYTFGDAPVDWDVDAPNANGADFRLQSYTGLGSYLDLVPAQVLRGLVTSGGLQPLPAGFSVGATLAAYTWNSSYGAGYSLIDFGAGSAFNGENPGLFGFRFDVGGDFHYGWARMQADIATATVTLSEWAWESAPGQAIVAGDTAGAAAPEGAVAPLALLAAGAAGVRRWRRRGDAA